MFRHPRVCTATIMTMLVLITFYLTAMVHESVGFADLPELLREYPTWSFELESVDSLIKNTVSHMKDADAVITGKTLLRKLNVSLTPGSTHIVKKVGDPKWIQDPKKLPLYFDAREKWTDCADLISKMQDEGACHTDSPVAVASVMSDRYCIFTNGASKEPLATEMLTGCAEWCTTYFTFIERSWRFAKMHGIPTGGPQGTKKGCVPYEEPPCLHGNVSSITRKRHAFRKLKPCSEEVTYDHDCPKKCSNPKYPKPIDQDLAKCKIAYITSQNEFCIRNEILTYGPVVTTVLLYNDFYEKPTGIYFGKPDRKLVAVDKFLKLIGWGEEDNVKYWLAMNTWDQWGDKVFKIPRGVNFDLVEYTVSACVYDD